MISLFCYTNILLQLRHFERQVQENFHGRVRHIGPLKSGTLQKSPIQCSVASGNTDLLLFTIYHGGTCGESTNREEFVVLFLYRFSSFNKDTIFKRIIKSNPVLLHDKSSPKSSEKYHKKTILLMKLNWSPSHGKQHHDLKAAFSGSAQWTGQFNRKCSVRICFDSQRLSNNCCQLVKNRECSPFKHWFVHFSCH